MQGPLKKFHIINSPQKKKEKGKNSTNSNLLRTTERLYFCLHFVQVFLLLGEGELLFDLKRYVVKQEHTIILY